jgi:hypothetical protein
VGNALEPGYLMNLKRAQGFNGRWKLDKEKGIAYLEQPTDPLKNLTIPLNRSFARDRLSKHGE